MKPYKGLTASILLILMVACSGAKLDTDTLVTRALHSLEQGYNSAAITDLKTALQQNPDHGIARKSLGIAYLNDNNGYSAAKELTHALNHIQDDAEIYVLLAKALMLSGQDERLLSISLNNYLSVEDKALVQTYQGVALTKTDTQAARVLLQRAEILSNRFSETALGMAMLQVMQKDYKGAKEWLEEAFNRSGDLYRVWKFLGYVENLEGNFKKSEEAYSQAIKLDASPDSSYMHRSLVRVYLGNMVGAREDLAKLTGEWKTHPQAVFNYGMIYYSEKDYDTAIDHFERVLAIHKNYLPALFYAGSSHYLLGHRESAKDYLDTYISEDKSNFYAQKIMASNSLYSGDVLSAERWISNVLDQQEPDIFSLQVLADTYSVRAMHDQNIITRKQIVDLEPQVSDHKFQLARAYLLSGNTKHATTILESLVVTDSDNSLYRQELIRAYRKEKKFEDALSVILESRNSEIENANSYLLEGMVYLDQQALNMAEQAFHKAISMDEVSPSGYSGLAAVAMARGDFAKAESIYKSALEFSPTDLGSLVNLSDVQIAQGRHDEAKEVLEFAVEQHPEDLGSTIKLLKIYKILDEHENIVRSAQIFPSQNNPFILTELAEAKLKLGDFDGALIALESYVRQVPNDPKARFSLAMTYRSLGSVRQYRQEIERAYQLNPKDIDILKEKINVRFLDKDSVKAREDIDRLQKIVGDRADVHSYNAELANLIGNKEKALNLFSRAFDQNKNNRNLIRYSTSLWDNDEKYQSLTLLESWLSDYPKDQVVMFEIANRYLSIGDDSKAIHYFSNLVEEGSSSILVLNNLAWLLREKKPNIAEQHAAIAAKRAPASSIIQDTYAIVLMHVGKIEQAKDVINLAKTLDPKSATIGYHRALILDRSGEPEAAKSELIDMLERDEDSNYRLKAETMLARLEKLDG